MYKRQVSDNLSDGDQSYAILLSGDNTSSDLRFKYVDPPDVKLKNIDLTTKGTFYISKISRDTDESGRTAVFTINLSSQPSDNITITALSTDPGEGVLNTVVESKVTTFAGTGSYGNSDGLGLSASFNAPGKITASGVKLYLSLIHI